ncbi:MAG: 4-hydroxythreonine-4-phosphate dehydrogenase PdxA [Pseudomonadota bacterium]
MIKRLKIGISMGDPASVGPEIVCKFLHEYLKNKDNDFYPIIFGDLSILSLVASDLGFNLPFIPVYTHEEIFQKYEDGILVFTDKKWNIYNDEIMPGKGSVKGAEIAYLAIKNVAEAVLKQVIDAVVTGPVNKSTIAKIEPNFTGHTEFFAACTNSHNYAMLFDTKDFKVALVTNHVSLNEISEHISYNKIYQTIKLIKTSMESDFNIPEPKIAVLALNPHGGEGKFAGKGEDSRIDLACKEAKTNGIICDGPFSADGFWGQYFNEGKNRKYNAIIAMYHDQGLIPVKMAAFHDSTNVTIGLPIVRTSVSHGTAYDIAGTGSADHKSLKRAVEVAIKIAKRRRKRA